MKTAERIGLTLTASCLLSVSLLSSIPTPTRAESAVEAWVQRYHEPGNGAIARAMVVDGSNNVIVTGFAGDLAVPPPSQSRNGSNNVSVTGDSAIPNDSPDYGNYVTIKYSSAGVPIWTNRYDGPANDDEAKAVAVDGNNDVIVTGTSLGSGNNDDYVTIKYSSAGVPIWTNRYDGSGNGNELAYAVAVDGNNDVIVTGYSWGSGNHDYATIKYSSAGVPLWTNRYNGPANGTDMATAVAVDGDNNVIVTGMSADVGGHFDYATIKYSSGGWPLWINRYNGPGNGDDDACAVAVDGNNNVIVTGNSSGSYATIKYWSGGYPLWTNRYDGPANDNEAYAVAVDGNNNVIVTGSSASTNVYPYNRDYATIKYSSAGTPLWTNRYDGPLNISDEAVAVAVDGNYNVVVTGYSTSQDYPIPYNKDYVTIKYSGAGVPLWTNRYNGPGNSEDTVAAVVVDQSGYVIVTGGSVGSEGYYDIATIKYAYTPMFSDCKLTNGPFQIWLENLTSPGTVVIEASTNLVGWSPVITNTAPTNVLFYTDQETSNHLCRFYRASKQ